MTPQQKQWLSSQKQISDNIYSATNTLTQLLYDYNHTENAAQKVQAAKARISELKRQVDPKYTEYLRIKAAQAKAYAEQLRIQDAQKSKQAVAEAVEKYKANPFYHPKHLSNPEMDQFNRTINQSVFKQH